MEKKRQDDQRKHTALEIILFFMYRKLRSGYKKTFRKDAHSRSCACAKGTFMLF